MQKVLRAINKFMFIIVWGFTFFFLFIFAWYRELNSYEPDVKDDIFSVFVDTGKTYANEDGKNIRLKNWYVNIKILENGNLKISEVWDARYKNITTMYRSFGEGVQKENILLPKVYKINSPLYLNDYGIEEGKNFGIPFNETLFKIKQNFGNYHLDRYKGRMEIGWGIDTKETSGIYLIEYTLDGASRFNKDSSEIFHKIIDNNSLKTDKLIVDIEHQNRNLTKENTRFFGHGSSNLRIEYINGKIKVKSDGKFPLGQMCEYRLIMPTHFLKKANDNTYNYTAEILNEEYKLYDIFISDKLEELWKHEKSINLSTAVYITLISATLNYICYSVFKIIKYKRIRDLRLEKINKFKYYTEVPADLGLDIAKINYFYNKDLDLSQIIQTTILKAIYFKILEIKEESEELKNKKELTYIVNQGRYNEIVLKNNFSETEKEILSLFIENKNEINEVKQGEINIYLSASIDKLIKTYKKEMKEKKNELKEKGYIREEKDEKEKNILEKVHLALTCLLTLSFLILLVVLIINIYGYKKIYPYRVFRIIKLKYSIFLISASCILGLISLKLKHRSLSTKGLKLENELKGFKRHLTDFTLMNERDEKELLIWNKILIYATLFGISKKVLKHLEKIDPEIYNQTNRNWSAISFYSGRNTPYNVSSTHSRSGGYGSFSGGGSSGGGGGGFGGGSGGGR